MLRHSAPVLSFPKLLLLSLVLAALLGATPLLAGGSPCGGNGCSTAISATIAAPNGDVMEFDFMGHLDSISYMSDPVEVTPTHRISLWESVEAQGWWGPLGKVRVGLDPERESAYHLRSLSPTGKPFYPADVEAHFYWQISATNPLTGEPITMRSERPAIYWASAVESFPPAPGTVFTLKNEMVLTHEGPYVIQSRAQPGTSTVVYSGVIFDPPLLVNEVRVGPGVTAGTEFVELFDGGEGDLSLDGVSLVLFDADGLSIAPAIDLSGHRTDAAGFFVVGAAAVDGVDLVADAPFLGSVQAVALYMADAADFPVGTLAHDVTLMDATLFEAPNAPLAAESSPLLRKDQSPIALEAGFEASLSSKRGVSLQRMPNGAGWRRATETFERLPATPGAPNQVAPSYLSDQNPRFDDTK